MLRALNDTPFVDKNKIVINSFFLGEVKILPPAPYLLMTLDDNVLIKLTWPNEVVVKEVI
jgi:hypothetical protein